MAQEKVEGQDVLLVQCISEPMEYAKGTKMEGQTYRRYNYGGKVFISNDDTFHKEIESGGVSTITLDSDAEGQLSMTGYITFKKIIGMKRNEVMVELITPENFAVTGKTSVQDLVDSAVE